MLYFWVCVVCPWLGHTYTAHAWLSNVIFFGGLSVSCYHVGVRLCFCKSATCFDKEGRNTRECASSQNNLKYLLYICYSFPQKLSFNLQTVVIKNKHCKVLVSSSEEKI